MARWMVLVVAAFALVYCATVLIAGEPAWAIPGAILFVLLVGYAVIERTLTTNHLRRHGGDVRAAARDDEDWAVPSAHLIPDDATPAGDTPEVHSEVSARDLPPDHPGRRAAEQQAGPGGTTSGNEGGGAGGRFTRERDETTERTGEPQRSAERAKSTAPGGRLPGHDDASEQARPADRPGQRFPL